MKYNVLAVILARGGSKGIPKKNIYNISGHPLISYSIEAAKRSKYISKIVVSTDDKNIANISRNYGANTPFIRSKKLSGDTVPSVTALYDSVKRSEDYFKEKYDFIIELPCVAPLRDHIDIDNALEILFKKEYDSVISYVNTGEKHPTRLKRITKNKVSNFCKDYPEPDIGSRRQDFEACYIRNGAIYSMSRKCIMEFKSRNGKKSFPFIMNGKKSINIDEKFDLEIASLLIENGYCKNQPKVIKKNEIVTQKFNTKKKNILITAPISFLKNKKELLQKKFNCKFIERPNKKELIKNLENIEGWICHPSPEYQINKDILKNANSLKIISTPSTGVTHIDIDYCKKNKIRVLPITISKKFNKIKASSEFTFLLCLLGFKNILSALKEVKFGNWRNIEEKLRGNEIIGKNIGIFGNGRIGKNLQKYFLSMNANVNFFDIKKQFKSKNKLTKNQLLKISDLVVMCISYNKNNHNFVDNSFFSKMKKNSVFVNTSRGEIVNEKSLIKYLKQKKIKCAILDVIKNEQHLNFKKNILIEYSKKNSNLIITPHMAGLTFESEEKAFMISVENIIKYLKK
jgi:D-3-phosphoglycerate dehydrogenase / 2-oxoglutarate reductase